MGFSINNYLNKCNLLLFNWHKISLQAVILLLRAKMKEALLVHLSHIPHNSPASKSYGSSFKIQDKQIPTSVQCYQPSPLTTPHPNHHDCFTSSPTSLPLSVYSLFRWQSGLFKLKWSIIIPHPKLVNGFSPSKTQNVDRGLINL